jgi:hypothetical protein
MILNLRGVLMRPSAFATYSLETGHEIKFKSGQDGTPSAATQWSGRQPDLGGFDTSAGSGSDGEIEQDIVEMTDMQWMPPRQPVQP